MNKELSREDLIETAKQEYNPDWLNYLLTLIDWEKMYEEENKNARINK